jgi:cytochrome b
LDLNPDEWAEALEIASQHKEEELKKIIIILVELVVVLFVVKIDQKQVY